ncbi:hypothetical protein FY036_09760 [Mesorhizobium microcysteis]|jgi:hypothetical protein|uniref:Uncharacterized protein n=1 Tax=Neoaquamicrobium microcysteis TaxID=2682781 RepID=A0A5D4GY33_9HYPH|nr:hypothetical protein [Mesorhizobium microcysteis]TYR32779.1 hypothetical protein FY036_09760 [Mesorhizobium microcysteis]
MDRGLSDIDVLIREEKRLTAVESYEDAWAEGRAAGIEPDIMADAAIATALGELMRTSGETGALALLERMRERLVAGEFDPELRIH